MPGKPNRQLSIDAFRAITMLLMIFVNDVSGVSNIPQWIEHVKGDADGMGFADTVFPTFLFIVGLSMPIAIGNRIKKQQSFFKIELHIILRSLALIVMGFFHVNLESYSELSVLPYPVWELIITICFFLIWLDYPATSEKWLQYLLKALGIAGLVLMACLYVGGDGGKTHGMRMSWGGILGIIGWAYLISATLYLIIRGSLVLTGILVLIFLGINIGDHGGWLHFYIWPLGDAAAVSLVMGGAFIGALYHYYRSNNKLSQLWAIFALIGVGCIVAGFVLRPYTDGISKIRSTPAWVLICAGIAVLIFEFLIYLADVRGRVKWFKFIKPAGTSTLTCYLMPYLLYSIMSLCHFWYPHWFNTGAGGILRSFAVAFVLIGIVGLMEKKQLRLKI
jgi:predicted acyltransferase